MENYHASRRTKIYPRGSPTQPVLLSFQEYISSIIGTNRRIVAVVFSHSFSSFLPSFKKRKWNDLSGSRLFRVSSLLDQIHLSSKAISCFAFAPLPDARLPASRRLARKRFLCASVIAPSPFAPQTSFFFMWICKQEEETGYSQHAHSPNLSA